MRRAAGFTLIELMVTLAVMAVLAAAGTPFALSWMDSNRQMQARNLMWEGISQARAVALRNPGGALQGGVSAKLQRSGNTLTVLGAGSTVVLWTGELPAGATTQLANAAGSASGDLSCVAFDNRGQRVTAGPDCVIASDRTRVAVGFSSQEILHVDLL